MASSSCRLPVEVETAALGAALQAAAVHQGADVAEFIRKHPARLSDTVRGRGRGRCVCAEGAARGREAPRSQGAPHRAAPAALQVVRPDPAEKFLYRDALERHVAARNALFP